MNFDINKYSGNYVMHCQTETEARDFCKVLHGLGKSWLSGKSYLDEIHWDDYREKTCYNFKKDSFCDIIYYMENNYTILKWRDFMPKKNKIVFDFNKYIGSYVMHCKTYREAEEFCNLMYENRMNWCDGKSYHDDTLWGTYEKDTCYKFDTGQYCSIGWYESQGCTVLEWSDFESPNKQKGNEKMNEVRKEVKGELQFGVPKIVNVIFNNPATIVEWDDGTKTVVKTHNEDFDEEKGLAMAITKKSLGNKRNYYDYFSRWIKKGKSYHARKF